MTSMLLSALGAQPGWNLSLLLLLAKATIILIAALGITLAMRKASATARHLVWFVTLGTLLPPCAHALARGMLARQISRLLPAGT